MSLSTSEQARADAMADAETLRTIALDPLGNGLTWPVDSEPYRLCSAILDLPRWGQANARDLAHAAFAAVPGLRERDSRGME